MLDRPKRLLIDFEQLRAMARCNASGCCLPGGAAPTPSTVRSSSRPVPAMTAINRGRVEDGILPVAVKASTAGRIAMAKSDSSKKKHAARAPRVDKAYVSLDERQAKGKALRDSVPRVSHAGWKPPERRRDPIELLSESNVGRIPDLIPIRFGRMSASPFAFYRGSAALMAADLATTPTSGLRVQACGDAHLMNFGGFATPERNIIFDINDFDETLPAPWEWDLKRLATSFVVAGRNNGFSETDTLA